MQMCSLPIALFAETSGTYINVEGQSQSFTGACATGRRGTASMENTTRHWVIC